MVIIKSETTSLAPGIKETVDAILSVIARSRSDVAIPVVKH
jgi:hypothetical protein